MFVIRISCERDLVGIEKQAGSRRAKEFVDLTADVAQIKIGGERVAHVGRCAASQVHENVRCLEVFPAEQAWSIDPQLVDRKHETPFKQHDVRREDKVIFGMIDKKV